MVLIRIIYIRRELFCFLFRRMLMVFCFFIFLNTTNIFAIDSQSPIFQQEQTLKSNNEKTVPPLGFPEEPQNPFPSIFYTLGKVLFALLLIVSIIYMTLWGLKIIWERRSWPKQFEKGKPIKILASSYLAPQKAIYLVEIGKKILILGVGREEINCLDTIILPEEVEALKANLSPGFQNIFNRVIQKHDVDQNKNEGKNIFEESNKAMD